MIWTLIGWALIGGALGYALTRWRVIVVVFVFLVGLAYIAEPSAPSLKLDGGWWNTIAFVVGYLTGQTLARRDQE